MRYALVTFDVGGVLMRLDRERVAREYVALAELRGRKLDFDDAVKMVTALDNEIPARAKNAPRLSLDERAGENFWRSLFGDGWTRLGLGDDSGAVNYLYTRFSHGDLNCIFDDVPPALEQLTSQGLTLGIVSNFTANLESLMRDYGLAKYFSVWAVSAVLGAEKPDRVLFDHAVREARCEACDSVHVGDGLNADVQGARGAGWNAFLLDRDNWYPNYSDVPRIRTLTELTGLL